MTLPDLITTDRLRLPLWTPDEAADILAGALVVALVATVHDDIIGIAR